MCFKTCGTQSEPFQCDDLLPGIGGQLVARSGFLFELLVGHEGITFCGVLLKACELEQSEL